MLAFFRYLSILLLGAVAGAMGILIFLPTFSVTFNNVRRVAPVVVREVDAPDKPAEPVAKVEEPAKPAEPTKPTEPTEPVAKVDEPAKPVEPVAKVEEPAKPVEPAKPMAEEKVEPVAKVDERPKANANQKLDYTALNARAIFWPPTVLVTTATSTPLMEKGQKVADIPLDVDSVLQLSKVLGDGTLEVRAQGLKFEIDNKLTDFEAGVRKKIAELADKGSTVPAPYKTATPYTPPIAPLPHAPAPMTPPVTVKPATPVPAPAPTKTAPKPRDTLDDKISSLFGRRATPEEVAETKKKPTPAK